MGVRPLESRASMLDPCWQRRVTITRFPFFAASKRRISSFGVGLREETVRFFLFDEGFSLASDKLGLGVVGSG